MTFTEQYRKQNELWYDLEKTRIPRVKSVIYAEIRVRCTSPSGIASLYEFSWEKDKIFWQLVDTVQVDQAGWIKLNATRIMDRWVQHPKSLQGLKIEGADVDFEDSEPFIAAYFERSNVLVTKTAKSRYQFFIGEYFGVDRTKGLLLKIKISKRVFQPLIYVRDKFFIVFKFFIL